MRIVMAGQTTQAIAALSTELADYSEGWSAVGAIDEQSVIEALAGAGAEAVVTGLHGGSGPALLGYLRGRHPQVVRLLLLDRDEDSITLSSLESAHRILNKPLQAFELIEAIESIVELRELLDNERLKAVVGQVAALPTPPKLYVELSRLLQDPDATATQVTQLVSQDPAMAAKVLKLCNSAYFSGGRTISDLRSAVIRLGLQTLRRLVLANEVFGGGPTPNGVDRDAMRERALRASQLAVRLLDGSSAELAATATLLAEVGMLLPGVAREEGVDGPHYAEAGAYLLGLWGLPMAIVEAVAHHHQPQRSRTRGFWVSGAVHVARALAANEPVDERYLASVAMLDRLPRWRKLAQDLAEATAA